MPFLGGKQPKQEERSTCWRPSFNHSVLELDVSDYGTKIGRYTSTKILLLDYLEQQDGIQYLMSRAAIDVRLGCIDVVTAFREKVAENQFLLSTRGLFLLNGRHCAPQIGYNDFEHTDVGRTGYFMLLSGP